MTIKSFLGLIAVFHIVSVTAYGQGTPWQQHTNAGREALKQNRHEEAEQHFRLALKEAESVLPHDYGLVVSLEDLALACRKQKKLAEAEELYLRALDFMETMYGPENASVADRLERLSGFYYSQPERRDKAELSLFRALKIREKISGPESSHVSFILIQLGYRYGLAGRDSEAEPLLLRALAIQRKVYGIDAPVLTVGLTYLAAIRLKQGQLDEAETLYQQVQDILEKSFVSAKTNLDKETGKPSIYDEKYQSALGYAARLNNLTGLYLRQGRYDEAETKYKRALKVLEQEFDPNHRAVGMVLEQYARLLRRMGRMYEAGEMEARARTIKENSNNERNR